MWKCPLLFLTPIFKEMCTKHSSFKLTPMWCHKEPTLVSNNYPQLSIDSSLLGHRVVGPTKPQFQQETVNRGLKVAGFFLRDIESFGERWRIKIWLKMDKKNEGPLNAALYSQTCWLPFRFWLMFCVFHGILLSSLWENSFFIWN